MESVALFHYDAALESLAFDIGLNHAYDIDLDWLCYATEMDPRYRFLVVSDLRAHPQLAYVAGGVAGDELVILDGKLLDILLEYAVFLALYDVGIVDRDPEEAVDEIGYLHNGWIGATTEGFLYRYNDLDFQLQLTADWYLRSLMSSIVLNKFAHMFHYHSLAALRDLGYLEPLVFPTATEVDDADIAAGMLVRKIETNLALAIEAIDILAFYAIQRFEVDVTYFLILSPAFQEQPLSDSWFPLITRKDALYWGHERFAEYWGLP